MAAHAFPAGGVGGKRVGRAHLDQPSACGTHHAAVLLGPYENTILNGLRADAGLEDSGTKVNEFDDESVRIRRS